MICSFAVLDDFFSVLRFSNIPQCPPPRNLSRKTQAIYLSRKGHANAVPSNDAHGTWGLNGGEPGRIYNKVEAKCGDFVTVLEEIMTITPDWKWEKHHLTSPVTSVAFLSADLIISGKKKTN